MSRTSAMLVLTLALSAGARIAHAARAVPSPPPDSVCSYRRCALAVVPAWNGLDVVRGEQQERVARLGFFWAHDLSPVFASEPRALDLARRAVTTRRTAAVFTDTGLALLGVALVGGLSDSGHDSTWRGLAIGGAVAFGIGVPLQFSADGDLSRATWWYNSQFGR